MNFSFIEEFSFFPKYLEIIKNNPLLYKAYLRNPKIKIILKDLGETAGISHWIDSKIEINSCLLKTPHFEETAIHELSHILANRIKDRNVDHGLQWKLIMKELGLLPRITHTYDMNSLGGYNLNQFKCLCGIHQSKMKNNRKVKCPDCFSTLNPL